MQKPRRHAIQSPVKKPTDPDHIPLPALGWTTFFDDQRAADEQTAAPVRVATVHRARMSGINGQGRVKLRLPPKTTTAGFAVGDWVLTDPDDNTVLRRLDRHSLLQRKTAGTDIPQLIAANLDTLFIVTSCNDDFNPARLERYLALANEAGTTPVIVLTKADKIDDHTTFVRDAHALQRDLQVVVVNAKDTAAIAALAPWCAQGQTVALVGSSGVGKSTLLNLLSQKTGEDAQETGDIREDDAKGRHTTTSRSLHPIPQGGWVIDTPGMRTLHVSDVSAGLDVLFAEISELAPHCRFRGCTHRHEPGCAVKAAVEAGTLDPERLARWRKLDDENRANTPTVTGARNNKRPAPRKRR